MPYNLLSGVAKSTISNKCLHRYNDSIILRKRLKIINNSLFSTFCLGRQLEIDGATTVHFDSRVKLFGPDFVSYIVIFYFQVK